MLFDVTDSTVQKLVHSHAGNTQLPWEVEGDIPRISHYVPHSFQSSSIVPSTTNSPTTSTSPSHAQGYLRWTNNGHEKFMCDEDPSILVSLSRSASSSSLCDTNPTGMLDSRLLSKPGSLTLPGTPQSAALSSWQPHVCSTNTPLVFTCPRIIPNSSHMLKSGVSGSQKHIYQHHIGRSNNPINVTSQHHGFPSLPLANTANKVPNGATTAMLAAQCMDDGGGCSAPTGGVEYNSSGVSTPSSSASKTMHSQGRVIIAYCLLPACDVVVKCVLCRSCGRSIRTFLGKVEL